MLRDVTAFALAVTLQLVCTPTPEVRLLPGVIDSAKGIDPVWLVDGAAAGTNEPVKTLWVFRAAGPVRVEGREIRTGKTTRFRLGSESPITDAIVLADAKRASAIPGGASREVMAEYAFLPSHVFYPVSGCYAFTIQLDHSTHRIVVEVK